MKRKGVSLWHLYPKGVMLTTCSVLMLISEKKTLGFIYNYRWEKVWTSSTTLGSYLFGNIGLAMCVPDTVERHDSVD